MSHANLTRWAVVDDGDPNILWDGDWTVSDEQHHDPTIGGSGYNHFGPPLRGSQHVTRTRGSMTFPFRGQEISVWGTSHIVTNTTDTLDPSWRCYVDDVEYPVEAGVSDGTTLNRWPLCMIGLLSEDPEADHVLRLVAEADEGAVWIDWIYYIPASSLRHSLHPTVTIDTNDAAVRYPTGNWASYGGTTRYASERGAAVRLLFNGTKATWIGMLPGEFGSVASTGSYSVDGGPSTEFEIPGNPIAGLVDATLYRVPLFETPTLPRGEHRLDVVFGGPAMPLVLDYFLVDDGDLFVTDARALDDLDDGAGNIAGGGGAGAEPSDKKTPVGAIVGGVVGGVAGLALIGALVFLLLLRRRRKKVRAAEEHGLPDKYSYEDEPFVQSLGYSPPSPAPFELSRAGYDVGLLHGHRHPAEEDGALPSPPRGVPMV